MLVSICEADATGKLVVLCQSVGGCCGVEIACLLPCELWSRRAS